ncbi:MAG TPA: DUF2242 domain-containing protein, partial [Planctomycetota bacterium]|nr:DUF2242 domain-containing protein [Planctomycetota bacterium]
ARAQVPVPERVPVQASEWAQVRVPEPARALVPESGPEPARAPVWAWAQALASVRARASALGPERVLVLAPVRERAQVPV